MSYYEKTGSNWSCFNPQIEGVRQFMAFTFDERRNFCQKRAANPEDPSVRRNSGIVDLLFDPCCLFQKENLLGRPACAFPSLLRFGNDLLFRQRTRAERHSALFDYVVLRAAGVECELRRNGEDSRVFFPATSYSAQQTWALPDGAWAIQNKPVSAGGCGMYPASCYWNYDAIWEKLAYEMTAAGVTSWSSPEAEELELLAAERPRPPTLILVGAPPSKSVSTSPPRKMRRIEALPLP